MISSFSPPYKYFYIIFKFFINFIHIVFCSVGLGKKIVHPAKITLFKIKNTELPKKKFELWNVVNERNHNAFLESRKFEINEEIKN